MFTALSVMESSSGFMGYPDFAAYLAGHSAFLGGIGIFLLGLVAAFAGGFVGAVIGGNLAFVMTGLCVFFAFGISVTPTVLGLNPGFAFDYLAFGPLFGPHISFAGGAAAAAYAAHKGYQETGKEITLPLARLGKMDVLYVGGLFGVMGYLIQLVVACVPWFGKHTDTVAFTVVTSAIIARLVFGDSAVGKASLFNKEKLLAKPNDKDGFMGVWDIDPEAGNVWVEWQARPKQFIPSGFLWGMFGAGAALMVALNFPEVAGAAATFPFAVSAVIILFLCCGFNVQVNHHMTLIGGVAAINFLPILMGKGEEGVAVFAKLPEMVASGKLELNSAFLMALVALIIGGIFGAISATLCEVFARVWYNRGTTHIDPPASTIWLSTTLIMLVAAPFVGAAVL